MRLGKRIPRFSDLSINPFITFIKIKQFLCVAHDFIGVYSYHISWNLVGCSLHFNHSLSGILILNSYHWLQQQEVLTLGKCKEEELEEVRESAFSIRAHSPLQVM
jgi:hypothetical protein